MVKSGKFGALWETKMDINRPPMAPHGPILSEDRATPIRMLAICLLGLFDTIFLLKLGPGVKNLIYICRSEGFPLTGLFHPWARWDLGLDTLENSSRRAAVAAAALWLVGW